ncbi:16S rRNA (adenine(1518)-N(6)/adenine(1519)-N(6))-dimethyltransferase RsmA [Thiotrichales bacterium 19S3-7]|nr:16S rRNA (adenine(1518)-N(6)/adenine(1519)-N(6))-dimethyltransferase RsmA [Thiotrichales bacterium 19S3-7]MCF6800838.1 16S rRNA (adenine(1518)-N(6)/adenine(1519)-N(6))-dimethyltransferase RsmA [Thiotrichales bacterium 19S3-11]
MKHQAKKRFGQNFLVDPYIISQIIDAGEFKRDDIVTEIGPGLGALTKHLVNQLDCLNVIEIDNDIIPHIQQLDIDNKITIYHQDALKVDYLQLISNDKRKKNKLIGNLPYNISTPLLIHLMPYSHQFERMIFMLQKEVIDRLCAVPNNKTYGRLSVIINYFCHIERVINVPPSAFRPQPKVDSAVIRLKPKTMRLELYDFSLFEQIVFHAFQQRRKTISNSLKLFLTIDDFKQLQINPKLRAENLTLELFVAISNYVAKL